MKVYPVYHVILLEPAVNNHIPGQNGNTPPPVIVDGEDECHVEEILDSKMVYWHLNYLVKWICYDCPDWKLAENTNGITVVDKFSGLNFK